MEDAADYRKKAEEAEQQARATASPYLREAFLRLARGWHDLARQAEGDPDPDDLLT